MHIKFIEHTATTIDKVVIFLVGEDGKLHGQAQAINSKANNLLRKAIENSAFTGKRGQYLSVALAEGARADYVLLAGTGPVKTLDATALENIGGGAVTDYQNYRQRF